MNREKPYRVRQRYFIFFVHKDLSDNSLATPMFHDSHHTPYTHISDTLVTNACKSSHPDVYLDLNT
jgi:hypothetical protein